MPASRSMKIICVGNPPTPFSPLLPLPFHLLKFPLYIIRCKVAVFGHLICFRLGPSPTLPFPGGHLPAHPGGYWPNWSNWSNRPDSHPTGKNVEDIPPCEAPQWAAEGRRPEVGLCGVRLNIIKGPSKMVRLRSKVSPPFPAISA